ncbi:MAG: glycosyl hydrolase, partial [Bacteroidetes bacterium]|nr:glycosyl hydrolase [Bacteroidota bacterium]
VVATQGRAFYVLDDLSVLQQMDAAQLGKNLHVFAVNDAWRMPGARFRRSFGTPNNAGENPPAGVVMNYFVKNSTDSSKASVAIMDKDHKLIKTFSTDSKENKLDFTKGMNQFVWDMLYPGAEKIDGMILWNGVPGNILAPPGTYYAKFKTGTDSAEVSFVIKADPNYKVSQQDYEAQFSFLQTVQSKFDEVQKSIKNIRLLRSQINEFTGRMGKDLPKDVKQMADSINKQMTTIEETLYQTKAKSGQDVLNYPIRLNDKLSGIFDVANSGNFAPSKQVKEAYAEIAGQCDEAIAKLKAIEETQLPALNNLIREKSLPVIGLKKE